MRISKTQCWAPFVIHKATFTKTAIKPKFVDRFSLKNFSAAIDHCTVKFPEFRVHWKLFKLSYVGAKLCKYWNDVIDLAKVSDKTFRKPPKGSKFVCIKSGLQFMYNLYPSRRNSKISRNSSYRFLWTSHNRRQVPKVYVA